MKICMVGPGKNVRGGVTTVINSYTNQFGTEFQLRHIATMVDGNKAIKGLVFIMAIFKILLTTRDVEIFHIHMASRASFSRKAILIRILKKRGAKIVLHLHGAQFMQFYHNESDSKKQKYIRDTFDLVDKVIALSDTWKWDIGTFTKTPIEVIYNAVPCPIQAVKKSYGNRIVFLGRIGDRKGIFDLLKVLRRLKSEGKVYQLDVGGDGDVEKLQRYIAQETLDSVRFHGWVDSNKKNQLLNEASILALPSYNEGLPMAILEAMAYGCTVVSTDVGGIPEVVKHGINGYVLEPGDLESLYEVLDNLYDDSGTLQTLGISAHETIQEKFSLERAVKKLEAIYRELAG